MLAKTFSAALTGVTATIVDVEANVGAGLPGVYIGGLADTSINQSRDRMKTAVINSGLPWPKTKVVVNLSPAGLPKSGSHFDLSLVVAIYAAGSGGAASLPLLSSTLFLGEVGLDGAVKPVRGVLPMLVAARDSGIATCVIPADNAEEATVVEGTRILLAHNLAEVIEFVEGQGGLEDLPEVCANSEPAQVLDMSDVAGQTQAKLAAEIAAAGGHHMMLVGPPGSGKSMIAARLPGILPPLESAARIDATAVHSVAGKMGNGVVTHAPFVAPHHCVSRAALLGGGSGHPMPGAVSLAHHGVLFLDEVSEIPAATLDSLRVPLETGEVRLVRKHRDYVFPANFQLVLAANSCRCGADDPTQCTCPVSVRQKFLTNVTGPLRDRIDLFVRTHARGAILSSAESENSATIAERVALARERARHRWCNAELGHVVNARVNPHTLRRHYPAQEAAMAYLEALLAGGDVSQRGVDRTLKVAWTLADLQGQAQPTLDHVAQAVELHQAADLPALGAAA